MHLVKDENGNPIHHGHTHEHAHEHTHDHTHAHTHEDGVTHSHNHSHTHSHDHSEKNESLALLKYMLDHNEHHAEELVQMAERMSDHEDVADAIKEAVADFKKGNEKLAVALSRMQQK